MDNSIRLLQVLPTLNSGGLERGAIDIAEGISKLGNISLVASNGGRLVNQLEQKGIQHLKIPVHSKNPFTIYKNISVLKKIIANEKINIIHTRSRAPAWSSYFASKKLIRSVSTYHNAYNYNNNFKKIYNAGLGKMDKVIAISNFVKNKIIKSYNIPENKIDVIYRGIDQKIFNLEEINRDIIQSFKQKYKIVSDKNIVLFPGRLTSWKGQIEFLEVLKKIERNDVFCYFVGDNKNTSYSQKLFKSIKNYNLENKCKILGNIDDMKVMYSISNIVVNGSQYPEGFGRVIAEAMSMGKPVIAYNHGAAPELLEIYNDKFKIPLNDCPKMIESINEILNMTEDSKKELALKSYEFVKKNFTIEDMISKTFNLYQNLLK